MNKSLLTLVFSAATLISISSVGKATENGTFEGIGDNPTPVIATPGACVARSVWRDYIDPEGVEHHDFVGCELDPNATNTCYKVKITIVPPTGCSCECDNRIPQ